MVVRGGGEIGGGLGWIAGGGDGAWTTGATTMADERRRRLRRGQVPCFQTRSHDLSRYF